MGKNYYEQRGKYADAELVECYLRHHSQTKAAEELGVSRETVARAVRRAGVSLDGRKTYRGNGGPAKITDDELREACKTMTRLEIAEKWGMHPENLSRRMKKIGCYALKVKQDGTSVYARSGCRGRNGERKPTGWHYVRWADDLVSTRHPGFSFCEIYGNRGRIRMKCDKCGAVVERAASTVRQKGIRCEVCKEHEALIKERERLLLALRGVIAAKTPKVCANCGDVFYSPHLDARYCSSKCRERRKKRSGARRRCKKYGVLYMPGITLESVYNRDNGICKICGKPTDWEDHSWNGFFGPLYPTIDHRVALANGGSHTWENVQLAHAICNSFKRDLVI